VSERFVEAFVDKLILLERKVGAKTHYRVMAPFSVPFEDFLAIQKVGKQIAEFIGLRDLVFIIAFAKQKEKVGGHIDLSTGGNDVFIEIDSDMMKFPDAVAATLCHEVCHKWLQVNGIRSSPEIDNEILTDISTVFLGFGKIMLNGCRTSNVKRESTSNGTRTTTATMTAGYLDRNQLAFVYRMVCEMRNISSEDFMLNLSAEAMQAVRRCDSLHGYYYDPRLREIRGIGGKPGFNDRAVEIQRLMADLDKHGVYAKKSFCDTISGFITRSHKSLESLREKALTIMQDNETNPSLRFLQTIKRDFDFERVTNEAHSLSSDVEGLLKHAKAVNRYIARNNQRFPEPVPTMFNIVSCPKDGTKMRLPENSGDLIATCPTCKYRFAYNTSAVLFPASPTPRKLTWWQRVRGLMRGKSSGQ
jgi:hypothetical protein